MDYREKLIAKTILDLRKGLVDVCFISLSDIKISWFDSAPWDADEVLIRVEICSNYVVLLRVFDEVENIKLHSIYLSSTGAYAVFDCRLKIK